MLQATTTQQPERLLAAARATGIKHGTEHLVDVEDVTVYPHRGPTTREAILVQVRFCQCSIARRRQLDGTPDDQKMSPEVMLDEKIPVPRITASTEARRYRLENVVFSSNGRTELRATKHTRFVRTDVLHTVHEQTESYDPFEEFALRAD